MITIQEALKQLYYSIGGNANNVRGTDDINEILLAMAVLNIAPAIKAAGELPAAPTDDGAYVLTATVDDGAATYSWEAAPEDTPAG